MKKGIFYIFFLIILPVSFGSSENSGCNNTYNKSNNCEKIKNSHQTDNSADAETTVNSEK